MGDRRIGLPRASGAIVLLGIAVYVANVYRYQRVQWDDAYITYRFAQHLAEGRGLTWNAGGGPVEAYSSLLQVGLLALGMRAGIRPEVASVAISVVAVLATVGILWFVVQRQVGAVHPIAAFVLGLYLADQTTAINSTSGLETQLFVVLLCAAYALAIAYVESFRWSLAIGLAVMVFLTLLCRPEGVLYGAGLYGVLGWYCVLRVDDAADRRRGLQALAVSVGLLGSLGVIYGVSKYAYFGYLLPNPYYVKSNRLSFAGLLRVLFFLSHIAVWYGPLTLAVAHQGLRDVWLAHLQALRVRVKVWLTVGPPVLGLAYYVTIVHEVGNAHRFSFAAYWYFVLAAAILLSVARRSVPERLIQRIALAGAIYAGVLIAYQGTWRLAPLPVPAFNQYFFKIAAALKDTGLGSRATVMCNAAGIIPYVSGFNQVDPVGLTDNVLSGRTPMTPEERERYLWSRDADVYLGFEPPAQPDAQTADEDPRMNTSYVTRVLIGRSMSLVSSRVFVQDRGLLHARMRELRDHWDWVGELEWPGWQPLKSFLYVRKSSPHAALLRDQLVRIIATTPERVDLNDLRWRTVR